MTPVMLRQCPTVTVTPAPAFADRRTSNTPLTKSRCIRDASAMSDPSTPSKLTNVHRRSGATGTFRSEMA